MWLTNLPMTEITYIRACFAASLTTLEGPLTRSLSEVIQLISSSASTENQEHRLEFVLIRAHTSLCHPLAGACLYPKYNRICKWGWGGVGWGGVGDYKNRIGFSDRLWEHGTEIPHASNHLRNINWQREKNVPANSSQGWN